jgi:hypothetical protein
MSGGSAPLPYSMRDVDGGAYNNAKFRQRSRLKVLAIPRAHFLSQICTGVRRLTCDET